MEIDSHQHEMQHNGAYFHYYIVMFA